MTPTTPSKSPVDKIREVLDRELQSCIDRLHHAVAASLRDDLRSRIDKLKSALFALESLSTQPAQTPDIDKIMEVVGTWHDWYADQPIQDGPLADYEEAGYVIGKAGHDELRARLTTLLQTTPSNPAQTAPTGPIVTHLNMGPNASPETIEAVKDVVRAAYSYKPDGHPSQTEGLEDLAREWYEKNARYDEVTYPSTQEGDFKMLAAFARSLSLPRQKGEVDMETVIDIRAAIIELMGTGVKVPTTEDLIAYMATSPSNSNP